MFVVNFFGSLIENDALGVVPTVEDDEGSLSWVDWPVVFGGAGEITISVIGFPFEFGDLAFYFPFRTFSEPGGLGRHSVFIHIGDCDRFEFEILLHLGLERAVGVSHEEPGGESALKGAFHKGGGDLDQVGFGVNINSDLIELIELQGSSLLGETTLVVVGVLVEGHDIGRELDGEIVQMESFG